jgi:hypothetical protein
MRPWQWLAILLALVLFATIVAFPFTAYVNVDRLIAQPTDKGASIATVWHHGFLPFWRVQELNNYKINGEAVQLSSGGNANVDWLVVFLLAGAAGVLCGLIFSYRPPSSQRFIITSKACAGFAFLGFATSAYAQLAVHGGSRTFFLSALGSTLAGIYLLTKSAMSRPRKEQTANSSETTA